MYINPIFIYGVWTIHIVPLKIKKIKKGGRCNFSIKKGINIITPNLKEG